MAHKVHQVVLLWVYTHMYGACVCADGVQVGVWCVLQQLTLPQGHAWCGGCWSVSIQHKMELIGNSTTDWNMLQLQWSTATACNARMP